MEKTPPLRMSLSLFAIINYDTKIYQDTGKHDDGFFLFWDV